MLLDITRHGDAPLFRVSCFLCVFMSMSSLDIAIDTLTCTDTVDSDISVAIDMKTNTEILISRN